MIDSFDREEFSRLQQKFSNRDIETELIYVANHIKSGWMTKADVEFFKWLAMAVLNKGVENGMSIEQIKWERDVAIAQLKELGYSLGEKIRTDRDTISRQAAIDAMGKAQWAKERLMELPSAQPQRTGHWIEDDDEMFVICSECGEKNDYISAFCPDCGAKMINARGEHHETD